MTHATPSAGERHLGLLAFLFAVAGGAAVGNLYWAQPLLSAIGDDLGVGPSESGLLVTVSQLGYAAGVFFLVPLGDTVNRRRMVPLMMTLSAVCLLGAALSPAFGVLLLCLGLTGVTTVSGQLLTPLIGDIADDRRRGRAVGTVASGIVLGILVARTLGGAIADALDWRAVYVFAAVVMLVMAALMAWLIPTLARRERVAYGPLLRSVYPTMWRHTSARIMLGLGAVVMCVFTLYWTALTFLLSAEPFGLGTRDIGLISLAGIAGAVAAQHAGRLFDRGWASPATGLGLALTLAALLVAGFGSGSLIAVIVSVALFSVGVQAAMVLLQIGMLSIDPAARSRLNTAFVVTNFGAGSAGSAVAGPLWDAGGWTAVTVAACALVIAALGLWAVRDAAERRRRRASGIRSA
ncbi:MFS transporter [Microbacterium sp.]|uniref:MFS transporter n=1 Tax=Microbacterium sp. TaxID=51671 RepID=UPI0028123279|nr:MFS transporter [Microbacterium sp.]